MKVSYSWLSKLVDLSSTTPEQLADKFTFAGAEVEGISFLASGTNLTIGHILSCDAHPDSDHLHILQVDEGQYGVHQIVCGAPNARKGLKVIVAREGAKLPGGEIKPATIRGVASDGMCCSLLELGVDPKSLSDYQKSGIEELPVDAPIGTDDVLGYLGLNDAIIDLDLLPNRPDLYAINNVAREAACLLDKKVNIASPKDLPHVKEEFVVGSKTSKCPLFSARVYRNVKNGPSPKWLKDILLAEGLRSIDKIVDIGNYVMLLTGQPLNMYDLDKLEKKELIVRDDLQGEFLAMDGNSYNLVPGDLVVTSNGKVACLAGIMTADGAKIDENTRNIVVEAAYFDYASIRHTSNRIGLSSDSSSRFCKGINPHQSEYVQEVVAELLGSLCEVKESSATYAYDTLDHSPKLIKTSLRYLNGRLGTSFSEEEILSVLARDNMKLLEDENGNYTFQIPSFRIDMDGEADLSEEVIRILGYSNVVSKLPYSELALTGLTESQQKERDIKKFLLSSGISEVLTYTLVSKKDDEEFKILNKDEPYALLNPMSEDREVVRTNLMHSLLESLSYNVNHQNADVLFFESSDIDSPSYKGRHLAVALTGLVKEQGRLSAHAADFYDVKGLLEGIMDILGLGYNRIQVVPWSLGGEELHPGRSAEIVMGKKLLGYLGELHPLALKKYGLNNAAVMELDLSALLAMKVSPVKASIPAKFPYVTRDLAFLVNKEVTFEAIAKELKKADKLITSVEVFDIYTGKGIVPGKKSMAIKLTLLDETKTLTDAETEAAMKKAILTLATKFGAEIRG